MPIRPVSAATLALTALGLVAAAAPAAALRAFAPEPRITCPVSDILIVRKRTSCGMERPACA